MFGSSGKVDHFLMPQPGPASGPEVEHSFCSHQLRSICVSIVY